MFATTTARGRPSGSTSNTNVQPSISNPPDLKVAKKLVEYSDVGTTVGAVNFPQVQLTSRATGTRYIHVHRNVPGILGRLNNVFSQRGLNITGQHLQTDGEIGYVVTFLASPKSTAITGEVIAAGGGSMRAVFQ